jgi:hypothetical protein
MGGMMILLLAPYLLLAAISLVAVLCHCFNDNLAQRVGLSGVCIGACLKSFSLVVATSPGDSCAIIAYGMAIYAVGTFMKFRKFNRA